MHRLVGDGPPKNEGAHEATCVDLWVDHCTAPGDMASRSAGRYRHDTGHLNRNNNRNNSRDDTGHLNPRHNGHFNRHNNRRYLHRGNNRDVLQRSHGTEHEWLRNERDERNDRHDWCCCVERRVRGGQLVRVGQLRRRQRCLHSALLGVSVAKRAVQLISRRPSRPSS
jgi:hypothetical protein